MPHQGQTGVYFNSDGCRLLGTLFLAYGDDPKPTAIILHGVPGIEKNYDIALRLRTHGWNSLIFHYRGCWGSEGAYAFRTIPQDTQAAIDRMLSGDYTQVDPNKLVLIGHSLGGWTAVLAAAREKRVKGLVVIGTIANPANISFTEEEARTSFSPWLSGMSPSEFVSQWQELSLVPSPIDVISELEFCPVLVIHGKKDEVIPPSQSTELVESSLTPCELKIHDMANHSFIWHRDWLISSIIDWLDAQPIVGKQ